MNTTHLIIVVPCYNEESVLPETIRQLSGVLNRMLENGKISIGKILFVDDGSKDKTWEIITEAGKTNGLVGGLKLAHNSGHQYALLAGLEWASTHCDAAISIDADLQDDVDAIEEMTDCFLQGADIVYGVRRERTTDTWFKKNTALLFYQLIRKMGSDVVYNHADFRLMSKRALQALVSYPERNLFLRGIVRLIGFPEAYVYYDRKSRFAGESKYPFSKMLNFAIDGITSFSVKPVRMILLVGVLFLLITLGVLVYTLHSLWIGHVVPGWTSLMLSVWFVGAVILISLGIVGEYIGKIYIEVKDRPRYNIESVLLNNEDTEEPDTKTTHD